MRRQIPFVRRLNQPFSVLCLIFGALFVYEGYYLSRIVLRERLEGIQSFSVHCQTGRDYGYAPDIRIDRREVPYGLFKLLAVVYVLAQHDLCVYGNSAVGKHLQIFQALAGVLVLHHFHAKSGICRMHRDVYGRNMHFYYSLYVAVGEIGKCDIVSEKERKAAVVVLKVYIFSHSLRILIYKAEYAFVSA